MIPAVSPLVEGRLTVDEGDPYTHKVNSDGRTAAGKQLSDADVRTPLEQRKS